MDKTDEGGKGSDDKGLVAKLIERAVKHPTLNVQLILENHIEYLRIKLNGDRRMKEFLWRYRTFIERLPIEEHGQQKTLESFLDYMYPLIKEVGRYKAELWSEHSIACELFEKFPILAPNFLYRGGMYKLNSRNGPLTLEEAMLGNNVVTRGEIEHFLGRERARIMELAGEGYANKTEEGINNYKRMYGVLVRKFGYHPQAEETEKQQGRVSRLLSRFLTPMTEEDEKFFQNAIKLARKELPEAKKKDGIIWKIKESYAEKGGDIEDSIKQITGIRPYTDVLKLRRELSESRQSYLEREQHKHCRY